MTRRSLAMRCFTTSSLVLLLYACGASDGAAGASSTTASSPTATTAPAVDAGNTLDPCSLLSAADIVDATGAPFGEGVFNDALSSDSLSICDWIGTGEFATVQVLIIPTDVWDEQRASAAAAIGVVDATILGTDAAYATEEGSIIGMRVDGIYLQVSYIPPGPGSVMDETTALATAAVSNLGI